MKKVSLYSSLFALAVITSAPAHAATVLDRIRGDIAHNNFSEAESLIKSYPNVASAAVSDLVAAAQKNMPAHPEVSAHALQLAASYARDINGDAAGKIARTVQDIVKANRANTSYCLASSLRDGVCHTIAASAAAIASAPAISIVAPQLYADATAPDAPKSATNGNPEDLQLAQQPTAPTAEFQQPKHLPQPSAQAVQQIQAAVSGGNFAGVQALIKKDASVTSAAVVALVAEAKKNVVTDPELSAQALQLAASHAKDVSPEMAVQVKSSVEEIVQANKGNSAYCSASTQHTEVCQAIAVAAAEFLSDVQVAFENPDDLQLAQQPTAPIARFQQPTQVWLTAPAPNPPSVNTLASGF